jgi:hypothetical protein
MCVDSSQVALNTHLSPLNGMVSGVVVSSPSRGSVAVTLGILAAMTQCLDPGGSFPYKHERSLAKRGRKGAEVRPAVSAGNF